MKIINSVNFNGKEIKNFAFENLTTAPISGLVAGRPYLNTTDNQVYVYVNGAWKKLTDQSMTAQQILDALKTVDGTGSGLDADLLDGQSGAHYLARANHTGTQLASTISDFDTQVRTNRLDQLAAPTSSVSLNSQKITGLAAPTSQTDAANKDYVDLKVADYAKGLDAKESVAVVATSNITLSGFQTIDGIQFFVGGRVLAVGQNNPAENGIYITEAGNWAKAQDASGSNLTKGAYVFVDEGTFAGSGWVYVGGASETWTRFDERSQVNAGLGINVTTSGKTSTVSIDTTVVARKVSVDVGNGSATEITITHNLNTEDVTVSLREKSGNKEFVLADVVVVDANNVKFTFDTAPTSAQYRATILG